MPLRPNYNLYFALGRDVGLNMHKQFFKVQFREVSHLYQATKEALREWLSARMSTGYMIYAEWPSTDASKLSQEKNETA